MMEFKVCSITNNPEQFKTEMEAVFGRSTVLMWKVPKHETRTIVHLGFRVSGNYSKQDISNMIPTYCRRVFDYDIYLM